MTGLQDLKMRGVGVVDLRRRRSYNTVELQRVNDTSISAGIAGYRHAARERSVTDGDSAYNR